MTSRIQAVDKPTNVGYLPTHSFGEMMDKGKIKTLSLERADCTKKFKNRLENANYLHCITLG